jgi:hypothetical protein
MVDIRSKLLWQSARYAALLVVQMVDPARTHARLGHRLRSHDHECCLRLWCNWHVTTWSRHLQATYALKVGELSKPVFSDSGVHLILRTA